VITIAISPDFVSFKPREAAMRAPARRASAVELKSDNDTV
jgi:hypothetical protein